MSNDNETFSALFRALESIEKKVLSPVADGEEDREPVNVAIEVEIAFERLRTERDELRAEVERLRGAIDARAGSKSAKTLPAVDLAWREARDALASEILAEIPPELIAHVAGNGIFAAVRALVRTINDTMSGRPAEAMRAAVEIARTERQEACAAKCDELSAQWASKAADGTDITRSYSVASRVCAVAIREMGKS